VIYVLVPAHNEAATIGLLLWKVRQVFTAFDREYQLMVVDDASTDGTDEVLAPYTRALPLTLVTHRSRQGYGPSLEELLRLAVARSDRPRRDVAVTLQGDFSDAPDDVPDLIRRIESGADLVLGDVRARPGVPLPERLARWLAPLALARQDGAAAAIGTLRAYRVGTLARMLRGPAPLLRSDGWSADLELFARAAAEARRIEVVPVASAARPRERPSRAAPFGSLWGVARLARHLRTIVPSVEPEPRGEEAAATAPTRRSRGRRGGRRRPRGGGRPAAAPLAPHAPTAPRGQA
jgi:glycosyltransferase involved in cell wall biosynthesis